MGRELNDRQIRTAAAVLFFTARNKHAPSMKELGALLGVGPRAAEQRTNRLRVKGSLVLDGPRTLRLGVVDPSDRAKLDALLEEAERNTAFSFAEVGA
jgi:hypothetical protein